MPSGSIDIRIDEPAEFGVIIAALEVVIAGLGVVYIATVAEGIGFAKGGGSGAGNGERVAPSIVGVGYYCCAAGG